MLRATGREDRYFASLGMPLVKTVANAGPEGKSRTERERDTICNDLSRLRQGDA